MEIARVFLDVSMSLGFPGLTSMMAKSKLDIQTIPPGKFTVFINKKQTSFKVLIGQSYLLYHNNKGKKFPLEAIAEFPRHFDGNSLDFAKAARTALEKKYDKQEFQRFRGRNESKQQTGFARGAS